MKKLLLILSLLTSFLNSKAQTSHLYFDHFNIEKGLPEGYVRTIKEDSEGYIWMGTQNGLVQYDGYRYKVYNLNSDKVNAQSYTNVVNIFEDDKKALWVSTISNGLFLYDRHKDSFQQYAYPGKSPGEIFKISTVDASGNLWGVFVSGAQLASMFNVRTKQFEFFSKLEKGVNHISALNCFELYRSLDHSIWLCTASGLFKYNGPGKPLSSYLSYTDTSKRLWVNPVYEAPSQPGIFWMNAGHAASAKSIRLIRLDIRTNQIKEYYAGKDDHSIKSADIYDIHEDKRKQLWFATKAGLSKLDRSTDKFTNYAPGDTVNKTNKNSFSDIKETSNGDFWISAINSAVYFNQHTNNFERYLLDANEEGAVKSNGIVTKMIDHTGVLWAGTSYNGAIRLNKIKNAFYLYKTITGKPGSYPGGISMISTAKAGYPWVATGKGIYKWLQPANEFKKIYTPDKDETFNSPVLEAKNGALYIGTANGLTVYETGGTKRIYKNNPKDSTTIGSNGISLVYEDHAGIIWLLSEEQGLCSFDPATKSFTRYPFRRSIDIVTNKNKGALDDSTPLSIYEDRQNNLWVGTNLGGLNLVNRETHTFTSYFKGKNKRLTCIVAITEDKAGRLWLGTYLNGLFEFDRKTGNYSRNITEQSGLLYNDVMGINEDANGRLWLGSQRGLSRLDPHDMTIKNFGLDMIIPGNTIFIGANTLNKLPDGRLFFNLTNGIAVFDPNELNDNPNAPIVHLQDVVTSNPRSDDKIQNRSITWGRKTLEIAHNQNRIRFNYIGLQYDNPQQNTYAYKLDGYDEGWVQAGTARTVTYTNLPIGTYTFHVKAANSSGVWNNVGDSIVIVIHPPWWYTWWMRLIYLALFIWVIYAFIRYRSRKLKRENLLLEEKISLRTHQLSEANKELSEQQEEITAQRDQLSETVSELKTTQQQLVQSEKLASLGELTAGIAHEIQNPLNFVNNFSEVNTELIDEMQQEIEKGDYDEVKAIANDIKENQQKINHHGKRADAIVKNMLEHSRNNSGEKHLTDINALADEYLRLSYHGLRAKDKSFNAEMVTAFDAALPKVNIIAQDIGRVLLNLYNNAFYAVQQRKIAEGSTFKPEVKVSTALKGNMIEIKVADNGVGIPDAVKEKIMQPFFTTKPTGEGTGLGLSLSYDIVVKGHGGNIEVKSIENEYTEFAISLPVK